MSVGLTIGAAFFPPLAVAAGVAGVASLALGAISAGIWAYTDGFGSEAFKNAAVGVALGAIGFRVGSAIKYADEALEAAGHVKSWGSSVVAAGHDLLSPVWGVFTW